ncbi:MAG: glycosyltransferase family 39 protein, partial [Vicinamibacterales bacterium]
MIRRAIVLVVILAAALALRTIGLQFGLPAVYNPDEVAIMSRALAFAKGSLNPHNFLYPTFYFYVLFAWVGVYLASVWATGGVPSVSALSERYFTSPTGIFTAGRALGVAAGTATVGLVYRLGTTIGGTRTASAAAIFLAVAPLHVRDSHYVKHDVPATLAIVAAYLAMTRIWPGRRAATLASRTSGSTDSLIAGAVTGVAFSTHYYCIFLALPLAWVILLRARDTGQRDVVRQLAIAAAGSAVTFFALSPFLLVEPATAFRDIVANRQIVVDRAIASGAFAPAAAYAGMLWRDAVGVPVMVFALGGMVLMARVEWRRAVLLLAFPIPFLAFIANTAPASRYLNPVLPFITLFAGWMLAELTVRLHLRPFVFWVAVVAAAVPAATA